MAPQVGRVSSATRTLSVIGTVHTPSRQQLSEVAQLIQNTRPDVVLVELDQPRLEQLLKQQQLAGPLAGPPTLGAEALEQSVPTTAPQLGSCASSGRRPTASGARASNSRLQ